ncbi:MAG: O-antigen ligase [Candidatus Gracilibacteria bacterium]
MFKKQILSFEFWMEAIWLLMVVLLPLVFFPNLFTTFELAKVTVFKGLSLLLFLLWITRAMVKGEIPMVHSSQGKAVKGLLLALAIFLIVTVIATVVSVAPALSFFGWYPRFQGLYTMFFYVLTGLVMFFEVKHEPQKNRLMLAMMLGMGIACLLALLQKFVPGFLQWWNDDEFLGRAYGTLANPNYLAAYLLMILPVSAVHVLRGKYRWFSLIVLGLAFITLLFTLSRSGLVAFAGIFVMLAGLLAVRRRSWKMLTGVLMLPLLGVAFFWYIAAHAQPEWATKIPFMERLMTNEESASSARTRITMWPAVLQQIFTSPVIGYGPETFAVTFPSFAPASMNTREDQGEIADHAHNEVLDTAVQIGIPGTVAYYLFLLGLVFAAGKFFLRNRDHAPAQDQWLALGFGTGLLGLIIANQFGFSVTVHWVFLVIFAAVLLRTFAGEKYFYVQTYALRLRCKIIIVLLVMLPALGMFWLHDLQHLLADTHMRDGYGMVTFAEFPSTAKEYKSAMELSPVEPFYAVNYSYLQLQRMYETQDLSAMEIRDAYAAALHGARLRGYDSFPVSIALEIKKISGLTF